MLGAVRGLMHFHFFVRTLHAQRGDGEWAAAFRPRRDPQDTVRGYFLQFIRPRLLPLDRDPFASKLQP